MTALGVATRWKRLPSPARWVVALAVLVAAGAVAGIVARVGTGNGVFLAGTAAMLASLLDFRLGGPRTRIGRTIDGAPLWGLDPAKRRKEIRRGWFVFSLGAASWLVLLGALGLGVTL